jgi:hypothetical protein
MALGTILRAGIGWRGDTAAGLCGAGIGVTVLSVLVGLSR